MIHSVTLSVKTHLVHLIKSKLHNALAAQLSIYKAEFYNNKFIILLKNISSLCSFNNTYQHKLKKSCKI